MSVICGTCHRHATWNSDIGMWWCSTCEHSVAGVIDRQTDSPTRRSWREWRKHRETPR